MKKYVLPVILLVLLLMPTALAAGNVKINDFSANATKGAIPLHTRFTGHVTGSAAGNVKINDFSANVTKGTIPLHTRFTGHVNGKVTTWRWEFHNIRTGATTYSSSNPSTHHDFGKPGVYDVTLKVWGPAGSDTLTKKAYVTAIAVTAKPKYHHR